jgi:uncharacterized membrane protein
MNFTAVTTGFTMPEWSPVISVTAIAVLAGGAALLTLVRAVRGKPVRPLWMHGGAVLLRLAAIALLATALLNPSQSVTLPSTGPRTVILTDNSASMTLAAEANMTRYDAATQWAGRAMASVAAGGLPVPQAVSFSTVAIPISRDLLWPEPNGQESNLAAAMESLAGDAADHVIVVSDGCAHDRERLTGALSALRAAGTRVSTHTVGIDLPPRNAALASVHAPRVARPRSRVTLPVSVEAAGFSAADTFRLTLRDETGAEAAREEFHFTAPPAGAEKEGVATERRVSFQSGTATARYTLELSGPDGEVTAEDNRFAFTLEVTTGKLRVLMVEGTHVKRTVGTEGHWYNDIELMTTAWEATGEIEWDCLTPVSEYVDRPNLVGVTFVNGEMLPDPSRTFPQTREEIFRYDVMLISDVPVGNFSEEQMKIVTEWVLERGGGFLMGGGYTTFDSGNYDKTPWEKIIPVDMLAFGDGFYENTASPFVIAIPGSVRNHPLWQISPDPMENAAILATHPPFTGMNRVRRAKPGALVLAVRPEADNEPVIAVQSYGRGRAIGYLPDPNGGWAKYLVSWGPPGGPAHGPHTELGHGENFRFKEHEARAAQGPRPPHPSPYYAQFWINVVKWLGENSIRWRRDKMSGRIAAAQAQPGGALPVAVEVLAVTNAQALTALDVGARLDLAGSPRVRLAWDRDRREFTGALHVPAGVREPEVRVLFDTTAGRDVLTDVASAGLRTTSREYIATAPDAKLMAELATLGGGSVLHSPDECAAAIRTAAATRAAQTQHAWMQPLWTRWSWWTALMAVLGGEWFLRRAAHCQPGPTV